jgi:hypothetical protein
MKVLRDEPILNFKVNEKYYTRAQLDFLCMLGIITDF